MAELDFAAALEPDFANGKMYWRKPPPNHPGLLGKEAGFVVGRGTSKNKHYWNIRVFGEQFKRSRLMFLMAHGRWPTPQVDHINGNSLDDRIGNLREATASQNVASAKPKQRASKLPRGIYKTKYGYLVRVTINGETLNLGTFKSLDFAIGWHMISRKELFGAFA